jgi:hypothetical protein
MNHRPCVESPGVHQVIDDADDCDAREHRDAPVPVQKEKQSLAKFQERGSGESREDINPQENQIETHIDFPSTFAKSGKKLITVENSSNSSATTLTGTAHLPNDHLAGGNGSPYNRLQSTQPMLSA